MSKSPLPSAPLAFPDSQGTIEVRAQHRIGLSRAIALCWKGVGHRLLRSALTLSVIVLAVAFFMTLLVDAAYTRAVTQGAAAQQLERSLATRRLSFWFAQPERDALRERLLSAHQHPEQMSELANLIGLSHAQAQALSEQVHDEARLIAHFAELDAGTRAVLLGRTRASRVLDELQDPARLSELFRTLRQMPALRLPPLRRDLATVIADHPQLLTALDSCVSRWQQQTQALGRALRERLAIAGPADAERLLVLGEPAQVASFVEILQAVGFADTVSSIGLVQRQLRWRALDRTVRDELAQDQLRDAWQRAFLDDPPIDDKMRALSEPRALELLAPYHPREQLLALASELATEERLERLTSVLRQRGDSNQGALSTDSLPGGAAMLSGRRRFLLGVSFVVCLVGIANAMFMAITERFREIATMKCLGATDGFILQQFLLEAALHGTTGGVLGALIGALLATVECAVLYGRDLVSHFPVGDLLASSGWAMSAGVTLAMLASLAPAWSASRMAPMDAMRVE
jgi:hypothetical protein